MKTGIQKARGTNHTAVNLVQSIRPRTGNEILEEVGLDSGLRRNHENRLSLLRLKQPSDHNEIEERTQTDTVWAAAIFIPRMKIRSRLNPSSHDFHCRWCGRRPKRKIAVDHFEHKMTKAIRYRIANKKKFIIGRIATSTCENLTER